MRGVNGIRTRISARSREVCCRYTMTPWVYYPMFFGVTAIRFTESYVVQQE